MSVEKYLITGISGFVSRHFCEYLEKQKISAIIKGIDIKDCEFKIDGYKYISIDFEKIDILSKHGTEKVISEFKPDYILHLASFSSVAFSWKEPINSFMNNTNIFLNILEAVRRHKLNTRILSVGSSEEYGPIAEAEISLKESHPLKPVNPYAVARVSQELLSNVYVNGYGLDIVLTRSFNHIGPAQKDIFVIASFAKQLVKMKNENLAEKVLVAGDVSIVRDFTDVRDVVAAYDVLLRLGKKNEVYNVCSGHGTSLEEVISIMADILEVKVNIVVDAKLVRPNDNKRIVGCNQKISETLGWKPHYSLKKSLKDILTYWDNIYNVTNQKTIHSK